MQRLAATVLVVLSLGTTITACSSQSPVCNRYLVATRREESRVYFVLFRDLPPVTLITVSQDGRRVWQIRPTSSPRRLTVIQLGVPPLGYGETVGLNNRAMKATRAEVLVETAGGGVAVGEVDYSYPSDALLVFRSAASSRCYVVSR
jgi:hypothetical protein